MIHHYWQAQPQLQLKLQLGLDLVLVSINQNFDKLRPAVGDLDPAQPQLV